MMNDKFVKSFKINALQIYHSSFPKRYPSVKHTQLINYRNEV